MNLAFPNMDKAGMIINSAILRRSLYPAAIQLIVL